MKILFCILLMSAWSVMAEEEESEALRAMRLSCEKQNVALGCYNYANMLDRKGKSDASTFFDKACKLGHEPSCSQTKWDLPAPVTTAETQTETASPAPASVDTTVEEPAQNAVSESTEETPGEENLDFSADIPEP